MPPEVTVSQEKISMLRKSLLAWYASNPRELPWKNTFDPYKIWLSEIILQQTRVDQGLPYYRKFLDLFPCVQDLARAPEDVVLKAWEGLGYYSRARNLHFTAKVVSEEFNGEFPPNYKGLLNLKGIGPYTAAAISSFAFNLPHAVVDGNVYRVLSRLMGISTPIDTTSGKKTFQETADILLAPKQPSEWNQAIMNLGAMVCTPQNPQCEKCPWTNHCVAYKADAHSLFPVKEKKITRVDRNFHFLVLRLDKKIIIQKRDGRDIWKGLYHFPLVESSLPKQPISSSFWHGASFSNSEKPHLIYESSQLLTHQKINGYFFECRSESILGMPEDWVSIHMSQLQDYAFPKIISNFIRQYI